MNKNKSVRFAAFAAAVLAALPLGAAELTHRWSFNGDYSDSVGGAYAVKCGTYVSLSGGCDSAVFEIVDGRENEQR